MPFGFLKRRKPGDAPGGTSSPGTPGQAPSSGRGGTAAGGGSAGITPGGGASPAPGAPSTSNLLQDGVRGVQFTAITEDWRLRGRMQIAGRLTDRTGVGRIVPVGLILVALSFLGLTQLEGDTSYWAFGGLLFVMGLGMGATMMPTFSGAMQTLRRAAIARASTTLNINQQVSASIGTAVLSVLLANELAERLPGGGGGGIGDAAAVPPDVRAQIAGPMAEAFGATFWWALALVVVAFLVSTPLLPKDKPEPVDDPAADAEAAPPVLVHG